jgi:hypothetical protein
MERTAGADPWLYEMREPGFNYRLPDILCALGQSQLKRLPAFADRRRALAARYAEALAPLAPHVRLATTPAWSRPVLHLLTVLIDFEAGRDGQTPISKAFVLTHPFLPASRLGGTGDAKSDQLADGTMFVIGERGSPGANLQALEALYEQFAEQAEAL